MPRVKKHLYQKCLWFFWAACFGLTAIVAMPMLMHTARNGLYRTTYTHNLATPDEDDVADLSRLGTGELEAGENQPENALHTLQGHEADDVAALLSEGLRTTEDLGTEDEALPDGSRKNRRPRKDPA